MAGRWRIRLPRRVWFALAVPTTLLLTGMIGYKIIEGPEWTYFDALYMTGITLTTVGYGETHPLTGPGRIFTMLLAFGGIFTLFYSATETIRAVISGEFQEIIGRDRMRRALEEMSDHVIVCGFGRMGRLVCSEFERQKNHYVIIDRNETLLKTMDYTYGVPIVGDATSDDILRKAGVHKAKSLICVLPSDADNLYITLSTRVLNDKIFIVARVEDEEAEPKLRRVGANQVVAPYVIGGLRVAQAVLRPTVGHFMEQATRRGEQDYQIEEIIIQKGSTLCEKNLRETEISQKFGIVVVTIKRSNGVMVFNPSAETVIDSHDILVVIGHRHQLDHLEKLAHSK